jgi:DNA-binding NtrC family response regulator
MEKATTIANGRCVLIIDDEPMCVEMLSTEMQDLNIDFLVANNGNDALAIIENKNPAVIISDYKMPGLNGIELLRYLRNLNINTPVIWMTGNADDETMKEAWKLGVFHLFQKPFDPGEVANEIVSALKVEPETWLNIKPTFLTESYINKYVEKLQIEIEKDLYLKVKEECLKELLTNSLK